MAGPRSDPALLTVAQMGAADRGAMSAGVAGQVLMDRAGFSVAEAIIRHYAPQKVAVFCGPGNNGGDGFVAARYLAEAGWPVTLYSLKDPAAYKGDAAYHARLWTGKVLPATEAQLEGVGLIVDALFGAGLDRPLAGLAARLVGAWEAASAEVVAVDVPSGLDGDSGQVLGGICCPAAMTVTFCRLKPGHLLQPGRRYCGALRLADIGIPDSVVAAQNPEIFQNGPALWGGALRWRNEESHKYSFGSLLIRGGAEMTGAGRLAARAGLRVGCGLVTLAAPRASLPIYALAGAAIILAPVETPEEWEARLKERRITAILIGPGNGADLATHRAALAALDSGKACLLDADALTVFAGAAESLAAARQGPLVVTPHEGEFARLFPDLEGTRVQRARAAAKALGGVVVLKGSDSIIAAPDGRLAINCNASPGLAIAGAGDVLSGLTAGLLAQGVPPFEAAAAAVWIHGAAAGEQVAGLIADDLPDRLPAILSELRHLDNRP